MVFYRYFIGYIGMYVPEYRIYRYVCTVIPYLPIYMYRNTVFTDIWSLNLSVYRYPRHDIPYIPICVIRYNVITDKYTVYTDIYRYLLIFIRIYVYIQTYWNCMWVNVACVVVLARGQRVSYSPYIEVNTVDANPKADMQSTIHSTYVTTQY